MRGLFTGLLIFLSCSDSRPNSELRRIELQPASIEYGRVYHINLDSEDEIKTNFARWEPQSSHFMSSGAEWDRADCETRELYDNSEIGATLLLHCDLDSGMGQYWSHLLTWTLFESIDQNHYRAIFHFSWPSSRPATVKFADLDQDQIPEILVDIPTYAYSTHAIYRRRSVGHFARIFRMPTQFGFPGAGGSCYGYDSTMRFTASSINTEMPDIVMQVAPWADDRIACAIPAESETESLKLRNAILSEARGAYRFRFEDSKYTLENQRNSPELWLHDYGENYTALELPQ